VSLRRTARKKDGLTHHLAECFPRSLVLVHESPAYPILVPLPLLLRELELCLCLCCTEKLAVIDCDGRALFAELGVWIGH
jgi:hypothetical protein